MTAIKLPSGHRVSSDTTAGHIVVTAPTREEALALFADELRKRLAAQQLNPQAGERS